MAIQSCEVLSTENYAVDFRLDFSTSEQEVLKGRAELCQISLSSN